MVFRKKLLTCLLTLPKFGFRKTPLPMSKSTPIKNYEEIFAAVEAGTLRRVVISPWHKGTDIKIVGDKRFIDDFEDWYNERWSRGVFHPYTNKISMDLYAQGEDLFFDISEKWDRRKLESYTWLVTPSS